MYEPKCVKSNGDATCILSKSDETRLKVRWHQIGMQGPQLCPGPRHFCKSDVPSSILAFLDLKLHVLQLGTSNSNNWGRPVVQNCTSDTHSWGLSYSKDVAGFEGCLFINYSFKGCILYFHVHSDGRYVFELFAHETNLMKKRSVMPWERNFEISLQKVFKSRTFLLWSNEFSNSMQGTKITIISILEYMS